jgi:hypothetical protein
MLSIDIPVCLSIKQNFNGIENVLLSCISKHEKSSMIDDIREDSIISQAYLREEFPFRRSNLTNERKKKNLEKKYDFCR